MSLSPQNVSALKQSVDFMCERLEGDVAMIGSLLGHKISPSNLPLSASIITRLIDCGMACDSLCTHQPVHTNRTSRLVAGMFHLLQTL